MILMRFSMPLAIAALSLPCALSAPAVAENDTAWMYGSGEGYSSDGASYRMKGRTRSQLGVARLAPDPDAEETHQDPEDTDKTERQAAGEVKGGPKPDVEPVTPATVRFDSPYARGTIVIDTSRRKLFYVLSSNSAYQYPISVGRQGFQWTGTNKISRIQSWPAWYPPEEMRERDPRLPKKMDGGLYNPLGAKALYLGKTLYRIHGTNNKKSIGRAASSGCFRMLNGHVIHLAGLAEVGTPVIVLKSLPGAIARSIGRTERQG
jgi:lipoprotein-anchoring transpeptidase ErfK/SrfK